MTISMKEQSPGASRTESHPEKPAAGGNRRAQRKQWHREVTLRDEQGWGPFHLPATDISASGIFLESDLLFEPGQGFLLEFDSPMDGTRVRVWSRVRRVAETNASGMGLEFLDLAQERQAELARYVLH